MEVAVRKVWYNSAQSAFEGRIDISRNGHTFRYPCAVQGPLTLPDQVVRARMKEQAQRMTDSHPAVFSPLEAD